MKKVLTPLSLGVIFYDLDIDKQKRQQGDTSNSKLISNFSAY